jgi:hypothetical protein
MKRASFAFLLGALVGVSAARARPSCPTVSQAKAMKDEAYRNLPSFGSVFGELFEEQLKAAKMRIGGQGAGVCWGTRDAFLHSLLRQAPQDIQKSTAYQIFAGRFHLLNGREDMARGHFVVAARSDFNNVYARYHLSKMARKEGDIIREREHIEAGLERGTNDAVEKLYQAEMAERFPSLVSSPVGLKFIDTGAWARLNFNDPRRWLRMAEISLAAKNEEYLQKAVNGLVTAAGDQRGAAELSYYRGHLSLLKGQESQAASDFHAFIQSKERNREHDPEVINVLFPLLVKQGELREARLLAETALEQKLNQDRFRRFQEEAVLKGGIDRKRPIADLGKALAVSPNSAPIHLFSVEILGGLHPDFRPERSFANSEAGRRQAIYHLDFLEGVGVAAVDRSYWRARIAYARGQKRDARAFIESARSLMKSEQSPAGKLTKSEVERFAAQLRTEAR